MRLRVLTVALAVSLPFSFFPLQTAGAVDRGDVVLQPATGPAGSWLTVSGHNAECLNPAYPNAHAQVLLVPSPAGGPALARARSPLDPGGDFQIRLRVPADTAPADLFVMAACFESRDTTDAPFTVVGPARTFTVTPGPAAVTEPVGDGAYSLTPVTGPFGKDITVTASNADSECAPSGTAKDPFVFFTLKHRPTGETLAPGSTALTSTGAFSVTGTIFAGTKPGRYDVLLGCYEDQDALDASRPYYSFPTRTFTVAAASTTSTPARAQPATAVAGQPRFTG